MTRLRMGIKPGVGPVMKVMANDADDPWTTPNTSYEKFLFNSEVDAMPPMTVPLKVHVVGANLHEGDFQYIPNQSAAKFMWLYQEPKDGSGKYTLQAIASGTRIFDNQNSFQFVRRNAVDWITLWDLTAAKNLDSFGYWFRSSKEKYPYYQFMPREISGVWDNIGMVEFGLSQVKTDAENPLGRNWLWPVMVQGQTDAKNDDAGPYAGSHWTSRDWDFAFYQLPLPINDDPYPAVTGTPIANKKILSIKPGEFKMAKPGYDTDTATAEQLIINSDAAIGGSPLRLIRCGSFTIAAGTTQTIELGFELDPCAFVDYQAQKTGDFLYIPPLTTTDTDEFDVAYKISGTQILFNNPSSLSLDVRYFVMSEDTLGMSAGSARMIESLGDEIVFRKPNTAGTRFGDVLYSTKQAFMPIVSQGWVPFSSFVASDTYKFGTHMHVVNLANGGWKPYVLAKLKRQLKSNNNVYYYKPWLAKNTQDMSYYSDSSFIAKISDSQVKFYCSNGSRKEMNSTFGDQDGYLNTIGMRYYIFAVPNAL